MSKKHHHKNDLSDKKKYKNSYFCNQVGKTKILFETKQKADKYLSYIKDEDWGKTEYKKPIRSYYCRYCGGWHVTSKEYKE